MEIRAGNSTASNDMPVVSFDGAELQALDVVSACASFSNNMSKLTCWISASLIHPFTSFLFANTSKLAPESLYDADQPGTSIQMIDADLFLQQAVQLFLAVLNPEPICCVNYPD